METAAQIAGWNNDARKLLEMYMILRNRAVVWWRSLPDAGIDRANAPMVDANGKPYEKKVFAAAAASNGPQVNAMTSDDAAKSHTVGSIVASAMNALNW